MPSTPGAAERLAAEGAHVVAVDVDGEAVEAVAASLATASVAVAGDVADEAQGAVAQGAHQLADERIARRA